MSSAAAGFQRHFLSWERPWLPQAAAWLARDWTGNGPLDLSDMLAIVPTRQSGRRLREALAEHAAERHAAVFPPLVLTPDALLTIEASAPDIATRLEALLAWAEVLREIDLASFEEVFPVAPPQRDFPWAWRLAESFFRLQTQLTEGGLSFGDVIARAGDDFPEAARWRQLAQLEARQVEKLHALGRREPHAARRDSSREPVWPDRVKRVVILGVPDPLPLAVSVLETWAQRKPVDVVIFAPESESAAFDRIGRPLPSVWGTRALELPDLESGVHLCADPAAEAKRTVTAVRNYGPAPDGWVALGVADAEVLPLIEHELSRANLTSYNPEGHLRRGESLYALLEALAGLARVPSFDAVATLARCPDFLAGLQYRFGNGFSITQFLAELDDLHARNLPPDLDSASASAAGQREGDGRSKSHAVRGLAVIAELRAALTSEPFPQNAIAGLTAIFRDRRFDLAQPEDGRRADGAQAWRDVMRECAEAAKIFAGVDARDWWQVALQLFGAARRAEDKPTGALELQGWLELLWEDAPHLIVAGLNDGLVPDAIVGDPFLPESLRERLGLKNNAARFARDAYMLQAIAACRREEGRLDLLFAKTSAIGDPLRPSRLLLRCADAELPARIAFLFRPIESAQTNLAWSRAWKLAPRRTTPSTRIAVTGLRGWLACPFRFYLQHVLRMEPVDPDKSEMDARDFGTLCHAALEAMAREPALRDCSDEKLLRDFLHGALERATHARYGKNLTLPLVVQLESAHQRLAKVATLQARERAAGWVTERIEWPFSIEVSGLEVRGKIDRIDRHEASGAWRVLDYKTSDTAVPPAKSHLRPARPGDERLPAWMRVEWNGRQHVWADLQLPMYLRALARENLGGPALTCGYVNLPKAAGETAIAPWTDLAPDLLAAADACADGVAAAIRAGDFWPPAEIPADHDAFAALFHHGAEDSVAWEVTP